MYPNNLTIKNNKKQVPVRNEFILITQFRSVDIYHKTIHPCLCLLELRILRQ